MAECDAASITAPKETESILQLREKLRTKMKISRQEHRHEDVDTVRIAIGDSYVENLRTYTQDDVMKLAKAIKHQKHAKPHQLNQLSHAFLQSAENIQCFLNVTGAVNVIVKELTGSNSDKQSLAAECVCNLSLGSEISCDKLALHVATYLITFLKSSNERLLRTSLWTITNLMASGDKTLKILVNQEVIKSLISVNMNAVDDGVKENSFKAIDVAIDSDVLRQEDVLHLFEWIPKTSSSSILNYMATKILYKLLNKMNFQWPDEAVILNAMDSSIATIFYLYQNIQSFPIDCFEPFSHIILLLRIIGNFMALKDWTANYVITNGFAANNVEVGEFFKNLLETLDNEATQRELIWVARNLLENKCLHIDCLVKCGDLDFNVLIEYWRKSSNVKI